MINKIITFTFYNLLTIVFSQNLELYLTLIEKGNLEEVRENLPELLSNYPNDPGVYFIEALVNIDGDNSFTQYTSIINNYPSSLYASKSSVKIGEYFFARGLYSKAGEHLKNTITTYPKLLSTQRAMDLMVNSYVATGEEDLAKKYLTTFKEIYPSLNYQKYDLNLNVKNKNEAKLVKLNPNIITERIKAVKAKIRKKNPSKPPLMPWVVQVGAFGLYENANRLKNQLRDSGFSTEVHEVNSNGKRLHAVRVVRFENKLNAEENGLKLKKKFGLDFRIVNSPE